MNKKIVELASGIVAAYVGHNMVRSGEIAGLIQTVHGALARLSTDAVEAPAKPLVPAVPIRKSVTPDHIVCLEDGRQFKSLSRHLKAVYGLTPDEYRRKWNLPADYPMVAPSYSKQRSRLAKEIGLGMRSRQAATRGKSGRAG
ncbi:MAG: MucR family transcriptional regulator [Mesorhizobium sp.]